MKELKNTQELKRFLYMFKELQKISRKIGLIDVKQCNGYNEEKNEISDQEKQDKLLNRADEIAKEFNLRAYHQGDPRGNSLYLVDESEFIKGSNCDYMNGISVY